MLAVEFRPEESRCSPQNFVGTFQLPVFLLKILDPGSIDGRGSGLDAIVNVCLANPPPDGLSAITQLASNSAHSSLRGPQFGSQLADQTDGLVLLSLAVAVG